jgi:hypothetical protein
MRMSDEEVERVVIRLRWADNNGGAYCPHCGCMIVYSCRRPGKAPRWRCKGFLRYERDDVRIPQDAAPCLLARHRDLLQRGQGQEHAGDISASSTRPALYSLTRCARAMASEIKTSDKIGGEGKRAEIDGGYFGGYVKPANLRENRRDRRLRMNRSGKRMCVVVIPERDGVTLPGVYRPEGEGARFHSPQDCSRNRRACRRKRCVEPALWPFHYEASQSSGSLLAQRRMR